MIALPKVAKSGKKRLGRGIGSGKGGHTSSRGQKGQKSKGNIHVLFEGLKTKKSFLKRLPMQRGKGKFLGSAKPEIVKLADLEKLPTGSVITLDLLIKEGLVSKIKAQKYGVKVLGGTKSSKKFTFKIPTSKSVVSVPEEVTEKKVKASK